MPCATTLFICLQPLLYIYPYLYTTPIPLYLQVYFLSRGIVAIVAAERQVATSPISPHISPHISLYLPSRAAGGHLPYISPYLPTFPHISLHLPIPRAAGCHAYQRRLLRRDCASSPREISGDIWRSRHSCPTLATSPYISQHLPRRDRAPRARPSAHRLHRRPDLLRG
jgi:hypothetical protein